MLIRAGDVALDGEALLDRVRRAAGWLRTRGLEPGDRLALHTPRDPAFLELHLAALAIGVSTLPLNPRGALPETRWQLDDAAPALAIVDDPALLGPGRVAFLDACAALDVADPTALPGVDGGPAIDADTDALLMYTSGTTGRPKGARTTHRNLLAGITALRDAWRITAGDVLVHALPLFHVHGLIVAQHTALLAGATTVWLEAFDADEVLAAIRRHHATVFMGVPTFYHRFLAARDPGPLPSMRLFTCGSAPLPAHVHRAFHERFGHAILERYGMTEIGIVVSNPYDGERVPGAIGRPLPGVSLRIVDADDREVADGEVGELRIGGPTVFPGYLNRPDATAAALKGGEMHTGDLGYRDARGHVVLVGRRAELVLVGGFNVYPAEVEGALRDHPAVDDVAVLGIPDDDLGERVVATVVPRDPGVDPEALRTFVRGRLAAYKVPRHIALAAELPRNALGKVQKDVLRRAWTTITIAPAGPDEADRIAAWNVAMARETEGVALDPIVARAGARHAFDKPGVAYRIARVHGIAVGQVMRTTEWSDWRDREVWWLQSVWVEPAWRGRGVFRALFDHVVAEARSAGVAGLRLYVDARNAPARAVYEKLGMSGDHYGCYERMLEP